MIKSLGYIRVALPTALHDLPFMAVRRRRHSINKSGFYFKDLSDGFNE